MILHDLLPQLMPAAIEWARVQADYILANGRSLTDKERSIALLVGVRHPEKVRILEVTTIPAPDESMLSYMCQYTGMLGPDTIGLTLDYGIYIRSDVSLETNVLAHECRHVYQYEDKGSIAAFLGEYLTQILEYGYEAAPLEVDARTAAWHVASV